MSARVSVSVCALAAHTLESLLLVWILASEWFFSTMSRLVLRKFDSNAIFSFVYVTAIGSRSQFAQLRTDIVVVVAVLMSHRRTLKTHTQVVAAVHECL